MKDWKKGFLYGLILVVLIANTIFLVRNLELFLFPGEVSPLARAKEGAYTVIQYSQNLAENLGVEQRVPVRDILARFNYEVERARTPEEVGRLMMDYGRNVQDVIFRELQNKREDILLNILNQQESLKEVSAANISISFSPDQELKVVDPHRVLKEETRKKIAEHPLLINSGQVFEVEIKNGKVMIITPRTLFDRVKVLESELANLNSKYRQLQQVSGFAPLSGPGIIVKVYDSAGGVTSEQIVHDSDIRDIVNELFSAGASGVVVGNQRLVATSSIRCAGPTILVNQQPISVNPIVIKAVGSPNILASSLDIIKNELELFGVRLEIEKSEEITLDGYIEK